MSKLTAEAGNSFTHVRPGWLRKVLLIFHVFFNLIVTVRTLHLVVVRKNC